MIVVRRFKASLSLSFVCNVPITVNEISIYLDDVQVLSAGTLKRDDCRVRYHPGKDRVHIELFLCFFLCDMNENQCNTVIRSFVLPFFLG